VRALVPMPPGAAAHTGERIAAPGAFDTSAAAAVERTAAGAADMPAGAEAEEAAAVARPGVAAAEARIVAARIVASRAAAFQAHTREQGEPRLLPSPARRSSGNLFAKAEHPVRIGGISS
jgi:hypothetical protein